MWCSKVLILSVLTFNCAFSFCEAFIYGYEDENPEFGEKCLLKNNEPGFCEEFVKCGYAEKLYRSGRSSEITMCKFIGKIPFVCCPSYPKLKKSSSKFQKALCKNVQPSYKIDNHIINGVNADVQEFPFQAALGYVNNDEGKLSFDCGGSLIADDIVLTAAHCVNKKNGQPIMVRIGRTSLNLDDDDDDSIAQDIKIETIRIHPKYSSRAKQNDIALIKLKKPFVPSDSVGTICLSTSDTDLPADFTVTGFGQVSTKTQKRSDWLQKGKLSEYPHDKCKHKFGISGVEIVDSQFCAVSEAGVDACQGDSGGPVIYEQKSIFYLHGLTSFGAGCGSKKFPAVYTKVNSFLDWIEAEMSSFD